MFNTARAFTGGCNVCTYRIFVTVCGRYNFAADKADFICCAGCGIAVVVTALFGKSNSCAYFTAAYAKSVLCARALAVVVNIAFVYISLRNKVINNRFANVFINV